MADETTKRLDEETAQDLQFDVFCNGLRIFGQTLKMDCVPVNVGPVASLAARALLEKWEPFLAAYLAGAMGK